MTCGVEDSGVGVGVGGGGESTVKLVRYPLKLHLEAAISKHIFV